ncbi:MAG: DNA polymerase III subunit delta [Acutalibacteraceae bacterium]|nr:DNA polymerase III subunit delta [Acutalibacteraceae bacterium]
MLLNEDTLKKQIKSGEFSNLYLLYGNEGYLKQFYANQICNKSVSKDFADFNLKKLDGKDTNLNEIYDCTTSFPMMDNYTCTLVKDFPLNTYVGDRGKMDEELQTILADIPETSILIFWMDTIEVDEKNNKWAKIVKAFEEMGASAKIDKRTRSALEKLLVTSAAKKDCALSRDTAGYMINLVGEDMSTLQNELNKVCAFAGSGEITRKHIDETVIVSVEAKIFNLSRMIARGEADQAFETIGNLFKLREEPVMILGVLSKAFVDMYRVKAAKEKGVSYTALADAFPSTYKGRSFILDNAARDGANYSVTQLKNALNILSDTDRRLKSTNEDGRIVLEELILRLLRV